MKNILITSSSKKVLLVKRFKEAASKYAGVKIFTADIKHSTSANFSDAHFIVPQDKDNLYGEFLINLCISNNIGLIVPTRDAEILNLRQYRSKLLEIGCKVLIPSDETIDLCLNKKAFNEFCIEHKIDIPATITSSEIKYPVYCKPKSGSASRGCFIAKQDSELPNNLEDYVIQEYLDWEEYSVDVFCDFESKPISIVPRKRVEIVDGEAQVTVITLNEDIITSVKNLLEKIDLIGHNVVQCFYKEGVVKFIEINLRFGGASNSSFEAGADSTKMLLELLVGSPITTPLIQDGLIMQRFSEDVFPNKEYRNKIFCVDIDGTLCSETPNTHYDQAKPIQKSIDYINKLYRDGNTIKLYTARGAASGFDWRELTELQMKEWGVNYHELIMKKPFGDYYIDNKAINIFNFVNYEN